MQQPSSAGTASSSMIVILPRHSITRRQLPILGVVQIIGALIVFVFGILRATRSQNLVSDSLAYIWGPVALIVAGCMTIYDGTSQRPKVQSAVVLNVAAGVASLVTAIIFFLDTTDMFNSSKHLFWHQDSDMSSRALSGFSTILCFFELSLSGFSAGIGHSAGCCKPTLQMPLVITNQHDGTASVTAQALPTHHTQPTYLDPPTVMAPPIPMEVISP